jgi:hypothetical protein
VQNGCECKTLLLIPVIKIIDTVAQATVSGVVTDDQLTALGKAVVAAQTFDADAADKKDQVIPYTSTVLVEVASVTGIVTHFLPGPA